MTYVASIGNYSGNLNISKLVVYLTSVPRTTAHLNYALSLSGQDVAVSVIYVAIGYIFIW